MSPSGSFSARPIQVVLSCDTDADIFDQSMTTETDPRPVWRGISEGIPTIIEVASEVANSYGLRPLFTWFVRVDDQVGYYHDAPSYLLNEFSSLWNEQRQSGDEVAWHPHLYKFENGTWGKQLSADELAAALERNHDEFQKSGHCAVSIRIGEASFSNVTANIISSLGIARDSSAMPGRMRNDEHRILDWRGTPQLPYRPSTNDYRVPGKPAQTYLEVPRSMIRTKADYDAEPYMRYIDLSFHHHAIKDGLAHFLKEAELLVSMTHPSGILQAFNPEGGHGLVSFDIGNYRRNLDFILAECQRLERDVHFVTMSQVSEFEPNMAVRDG